MSMENLSENLRKFVKIKRVKELKKDQAFQELEKKKHEVIRAENDVSGKTEEAERSKAALPERIDRIYIGVMQKILSPGDLEEQIKGEIIKVEAAHQKLVDQKDRAKHVFLRLSDELKEKRNYYHQTVKDTDKYTLLTEQMIDQKKSIEADKEEAEIEDSFRLKRIQIS